MIITRVRIRNRFMTMSNKEFKVCVRDGLVYHITVLGMGLVYFRDGES